MSLPLAPVIPTSNLNSAAAGQAALRLIQEQDLKRMAQMNAIVQITNEFSNTNSLKTSSLIEEGAKNEAKGLSDSATFSMIAGGLQVTGGVINLGITGASISANSKNVSDMNALGQPPGGVAGPGGVGLVRAGAEPPVVRTEGQIEAAMKAVDKKFGMGSQLTKDLTEGLSKASEGYGTQLRADQTTLKADKDAAKAATENMAQQYNTVSQQLGTLVQHATDEIYEKVRALGQYNDYRMVPA